MAEEDREAKQPDESKDERVNPEDGNDKVSTKSSSSYRDDGV